MSIVSTIANYGGRIDTQQGNIKQFINSSSKNIAQWIYKTYNKKIVQTPLNNTTTILINNDLIVTGTIYNPSDKKNKIKLLNEKSQLIEDFFTINPIIFNYTNDKKSKTHFGFLEEDIEQYFPELIDEFQSVKNINYQEIIPIMFSKIQHLQKQIDELKNN